jgi:hypothetical protein
MVICEIDAPETDERIKKVFLKDTKNQDLFWLEFLDIGLYLRDFHNEKYLINIFISNIKVLKLQTIVNNYLQLWEGNTFQSAHSNFYKKEKQIEIVKNHIHDLLKDYDKNNLIIKMSSFNDWIHDEDISECPINILATILYLEKTKYLKLKELRLWREDYYQLMFIVDIFDNNKDVEEKNKPIFALNNWLLSYKSSIKVFWKQKDLIEALLKNNWSILENYAYEYIYWNLRKNDPIRSLIVNTNKKLDQVGYKYKIHKENGRIVLEMW